ncbi:MAG: hypothetical protein K0S12_1942 [Bacteroidetes bacterium]|jgi:hypothetical protein|nr:hypothetical protein [Bacteroidota bacterium]
MRKTLKIKQLNAKKMKRVLRLTSEKQGSVSNFAMAGFLP